MKEYSNMTSSEKLIALIDGELPSEETTTLFYELAQNVELQEEMREQLAIRQFFATKQLVPPDYLKHKILHSIGLGSFLSIASAKLTSSGLGFVGLSTLKSKAFLMLSSALIGSLFTLYFTENFQSDKNITFDEPVPIIHSFQIDEPQNNYRIEADLTQPASITKNTKSNPSQIVSKFKTSEDEPFFDYNSSINGIKIVSVDKYQSQYKPLKYRNVLHNETEKYDFDKPVYPKFVDYLSLQIRGFATRSIPELNVPPLDNPVMNNMAIALFYKFDKNMQVGIEVGQENFMQEYYQYEMGNLKRDIKQNYTAFWTGVSFQYNIAEYGYNQKLYPFTRAFLGGTNVGPLLRGMIGLQFDYENSFSLFTGIESTALFYRYSGNTFSTYKLGLTFGGSVNF